MVINIKYKDRWHMYREGFTITKDPSDAINVIFKVSDHSISFAVITVKDIVLQSDTTSGGEVTMNLLGGDDGTTASVKLNLSNSDGEVMERTFYVKIEEK